MKKFNKYDKGIKSYILERKTISRGAAGGATKKVSILVSVTNQDNLGNTFLGIGKGIGSDFNSAHNSATKRATANLKKIPKRFGTIFHDIKVRQDKTELIVKKKKSSGVVAGGVGRKILHSCYEGICVKKTGSSNSNNFAKAILKALSQQETIKEIAQRRGLPRKELVKMIMRSFGKEIK